MTTLFVRHKVKEYDAWKVAYDAFSTERKTMGVTNHDIYQATDNPNDVTVCHEFDNFDAAKAFIDSPKLKEAMTTAGVVGDPDIWFTTKK